MDVDAALLSSPPLPLPSRTCTHARTRSITGYTDHCTSYVLLAVYGLGSEELEKIPVMRGPQWSAAKLLDQPACLTYTVTTPESVAKLPADLLVREEGWVGG